MGTPSQDELRDRLEQFISRRKYGSIARISEISGVGRNWIGDFRNGREIAQKSANSIAHALNLLEADAKVERAAETQVVYASHVDVWDVMASDFESIAKRLRSHGYTPADKIRHLRKWLVDAQREVETFAAKLKARQPRPLSNRK